MTDRLKKIACRVSKGVLNVGLKKNWQYFWGGLLLIAVALIALAVIYFWKQGMIIL
jgi:hypothetical protein